MPIRAGTASPTFRLGTASVSRMYLGSVVAYDTATTDGGGGTTPPSPPGALPKPTNLAVVAGDASVVLQFRSATGPTGFQIQQSTNNGALWVNVPTGYTYSQTVANNIITGTATIGSLANGSTYVFRVAGTSASAVGPYSEASPSAILRTTPTTPTGLTAAVDGRYVVLSWTASTGSGAIEYTVQASSDGGTTWSWAASRVQQPIGSLWPGSGSGSIVPGTSYVFRVCATYAPIFEIPGVSVHAPSSAFSSQSAAVTAPLQPPLAPAVTVEPTSAGGVITVLPPSWNGNSAITEYRVYVYAASSSRPSTPTHTISGASGGSVATTGLTNGTEYKVDVSAVNVAGVGDFAQESLAPSADTPPQVPPLTLECTPRESFSNGFTPEWRTPVYVKWESSGYASRPTAPLFEVQYRPAYRPSWTTWLFAVQANPTLTPPIYYARVTAVNPSESTEFRVREVAGSKSGPWRYATTACP